MSLIDWIRGRFYHPIYIYTSEPSLKVTFKEQYIFIYSKNVHSIKEYFYGHLNLFKAGCRSYLENIELAKDIYSYRLAGRMTMIHVFFHNLFKRNKIIIIDACIKFPEFSYTSNSYMVDSEEQMKSFPYKFEGQLFCCNDTSKYFYYSNGEYIEK